MLLVVSALLAMIPAAAVAQDPSQYVLGPEDLIAVTVVDMPKFSGEYLIPTTGVISMPVVGEVKAAGMTIDSLRDFAVEKLKARLKNPEVVVVLKVPRPRRVYAYGDVRSSGVFELRDGWRVSELLSAAGGLGPNVLEQDVRVVVEKAATKEKLEMTLSEAINGPQAGSLVLAPGDVVRFNSVAMTPVYVSGKVKSPGLYRLREKEAGVLEALAQAGGVTEDANITSVRVIRLNGSEEKIDLAPSMLRGEKVQLPKLNSGDMVLVSESQNRFVILGYVSKPGYYSIPSGTSITLAEAVARAEGPEKRASLSKVGIVRQENGKEVRKVYDLGKFLGSKGDMSQNPTLMAGDVVYVPETNKVDLLQLLSGLASSALFLDRIRR
jgi:polysaccharide export outer membrane protein